MRQGPLASQTALWAGQPAAPSQPPRKSRQQRHRSGHSMHSICNSRGPACNIRSDSHGSAAAHCHCFMKEVTDACRSPRLDVSSREKQVQSAPECLHLVCMLHCLNYLVTQWRRLHYRLCISHNTQVTLTCSTVMPRTRAVSSNWFFTRSTGRQGDKQTTETAA